MKSLFQQNNFKILLSNPDSFFKKLDKWCSIYEIYPPANKFGDQLSSLALDALIQKLKPIDVEGRGVEGRGDLANLQTQLRAFVTSDMFMQKLNDFGSEEGAQFKELIGGFVRNGWCVGLLNLMELAQEAGISEAIAEFQKRIQLDKDMPLTWETLKTILLREFSGMKRQTLNALVEKVTGMRHSDRPHDAWYVEGLLGGIIGLRETTKMPDFDIWHMTSPATTEKSLQEMLDLFHEELTPISIMNHLNQMIVENRLSIIDPMSGGNIIWPMLSLAAKEELANKEIDSSLVDIDELLYNEHEKGATQLALALLLNKLGIFQEVNAGGMALGDL